MKKYKIEFYSQLLEKRIVKVVDNPQDYKDAIILGVVDDEPKQLTKFDLVAEIKATLDKQTQIAMKVYGGAR